MKAVLLILGWLAVCGQADARGRVASETDRLGGVTAYAYDANGNLTSLTDKENQTTTYAYGVRNLLLTEQYPDHAAGWSPGDPGYGIKAYSYDAARRILVDTDQSGDTVTHLYNLAGRQTAREYRTLANSPSGPVSDTDTFTYDDAGRILTATKGRYNNTVAYTYTDTGRLATESLTLGGQTYTIDHDPDGGGWDYGGNPVEMHFPDGTYLRRVFNPEGQITALRYNSDTESLEERQYDAGGRLLKRRTGMFDSTSPELVTTDYTYRSDNLLSLATRTSGVYWGGAGASDYADVNYSYDANKNRTSESIQGVMSGRGYSVPAGGYDDENRLVTWNRSDGQQDQSWSLTSQGDWQNFTENASTETRTHTAAHELTDIDGTPVAYDVQGRLTQQTDGRQFMWGSDNELVSAIVPQSASTGSVGTHSYQYDALGRRVAKTVDNGDGTSSTTILVSAGQRVVAEYAEGSPPSDPLRKYIHATSLDEVSVLIDATTSLEKFYHYHHNALNNVAALTNAGEVVERYAYDAYGQPTILAADGTTERTASTIDNAVMYTGREFDAESGLHFYRHRYTDPQLGRFIRRDPIGYRGGTNLYEYVGSQPTGFTDPLGLCPAFPKPEDFYTEAMFAETVHLWHQCHISRALAEIPRSGVSAIPLDVINAQAAALASMDKKLGDLMGMEQGDWAKQIESTYTHYWGLVDADIEDAIREQEQLREQWAGQLLAEMERQGKHFLEGLAMEGASFAAGPLVGVAGKPLAKFADEIGEGMKRFWRRTLGNTDEAAEMADEMRTLWRAPPRRNTKPGSEVVDGFDPNDYPGEGAFFGTRRDVAEGFQRHGPYQNGLQEIKISEAEYQRLLNEGKIRPDGWMAPGESVHIKPKDLPDFNDAIKQGPSNIYYPE